MAAAALAKAGHSVTYTTVPWSRALSDVGEGRAEGAVGASPSEANQLLFPAEPLGRSQNVFVLRANDGWAWSGPASLAGKRIGTVRDYSYGQELDAALKGLKTGIEPVGGNSPLESNLRKLAAGRIDMTIDDVAVVDYNLRQFKMGDAFRKVAAGQPESLYIAFSPAHPKAADYARQLSEGVAAMRADGSLAKILADYSVTDWK